jgi:ubiquinone/menaquinone biosynthesis C-methylase UbiE
MTDVAREDDNLTGSLTTIAADIAYLGPQKLGDAVSLVKLKTQKTFGRDSEKGNLPQSEWQRIAAALERCPKGGSILDIGIGRGLLSNSLVLSGKYDRVVGIDVAAHSLFRSYSDKAEYYTMSVEDMCFDDDEFDSVVCLEVLSHLTMSQIGLAVEEMRRVARRYLLVSVPFCQPVPLPQHHRQRFTPAEVRELFPDAKLTLLIKGGKSSSQGTPILFIEEQYDAIATQKTGISVQVGQEQADFAAH